jgi:hypothetical protein
MLPQPSFFVPGCSNSSSNEKSLKLKHSQSNCPISPVPRVPQLILFSAKTKKSKMKEMFLPEKEYPQGDLGTRGENFAF